MVVFGVRPHNFHLVVFPMPISISATLGPFSLADTHGPKAPATVTKNIFLIIFMLKELGMKTCYLVIILSIRTQPKFELNPSKLN